MQYDNQSIRRQDRLLEEPHARVLLREGEYAFLAMQELGGGGYGIPVSYVWDGAEAIYLHCAPEGHKLQCLAASNKVCLCVVGATQVAPAKFTTAYESILLRGEAQIGLSASERMHALELLVAKYAPAEQEIGRKYAAKSFDRTEIIRLDLETMSGKCKVVK